MTQPSINSGFNLRDVVEYEFDDVSGGCVYGKAFCGEPRRGVRPAWAAGRPVTAGCSPGDEPVGDRISGRGCGWV